MDSTRQQGISGGCRSGPRRRQGDVRYRNNVDESELGFEDRWGLLSDGQREELLNAIECYIDKRLCNIDEDLIDAMDGAEARAAARALA